MPPPLSIPPDCLRPFFTEQIANYLAAGRSVNVYGKEGHGLGRLIEDLGRCCPEGVKFIPISMKSYADSYDGFIQALCDALHIREQDHLDLRTVLNRYLDSHKNYIWLCLEEFNRLSERKMDNKKVDAKGYDLNFLNYLNSLNNNQRVALLLTSQREINTQELSIGGQRVRGSRLDIAIEDIANKIPTRSKTTLIGFNPKMDFWKKDYKSKHAKTWDRRIADWELTVHIWAERIDRIFGISKTLRRINKKVALIIGGIASILLGLWNYGEQLAAWVSAFFSK